MALIRRKIFWIVLFLTLVGAILRLYRLPDSLQFLGDQGRDALRVARMFKQGDLVFIGPVTSIGNMYLGPLYYYFMLPWLWATYPSPLGPAYGVALLSILAIPLLYILGSQLVGKKAALFATICMSVSSVLITYSRFSWNPNPAPLFGLLLMWALFHSWKTHPKYWLLVATFFSILIQLHYITLLSLLPILIILFLKIKESAQSTKQLFLLAKYVLVSVLIGLIFVSPLIFFDLKHGGTNQAALRELIGGKNSITVSKSTNILGKLWSIAEETHGRSMQLLFDMHVGQVRGRNTVLVALTLIGILLLIQKNRQLTQGETVVLLFVFTTIFGVSIYSHSLYDHYVLFVIPAVLLLFGILGSFFWRLHLITRLCVPVFLLAYIIYNLSQFKFTPTSTPLSVLMASAQEIADHLRPNEPYNVVLLAETKDYYGQNYRYFLDTIPNKAPLNPDHDDLNAVNTLVIINEEGVPLDEIDNLPLFEIATFKDIDQKQIITLPSGIEAYLWRK